MEMGSFSIKRSLVQVLIDALSQVDFDQRLVMDIHFVRQQLQLV
jgi:hypothetical protein